MVKELVPRKFIREKLERGNHRNFYPSKISSYTVIIITLVSNVAVISQLIIFITIDHFHITAFDI